MTNPFEAFPALCLRYGRPGHLVHVGAHAGQEMPYYRQAAARQITLIEPNPELAAGLRVAHPDVDVVDCACGAAPGRAPLFVTQLSNMSSLSQPDLLLVDRVVPVDVRRLDEVTPDADTAVIDAQG